MSRPVARMAFPVRTGERVHLADVSVAGDGAVTLCLDPEAWRAVDGAASTMEVFWMRVADVARELRAALPREG